VPPSVCTVESIDSVILWLNFEEGYSGKRAEFKEKVGNQSL